MTAPPWDRKGSPPLVVRRALATCKTVATGNALAEPSWAEAISIVTMSLRTIVCIPLLSPRTERGTPASAAHPLGVIYVDNHDSSAPFSADRLTATEALARHASLATENAQLFERQRATLATVLMIVERHGGRIDLETAPGAGTTFSIRLPAAEEAGSSPAPGRRHACSADAPEAAPAPPP